MFTALTILLSATAGAITASIPSCLPGLHAYSLMGLLALPLYAQAGLQAGPAPEVVVSFAAGMIVSFSLLSGIPSILLAAPDDSALFTVLPGQRYLMAGRGHEAVLTTAAGGASGILLLLPALALFAPRLLPPAWTVLRPHTHWVLWCVITFMLMSEWPKGGSLGPAGWRRFLEAWRSPGAGLLTFGLSGILGFVLLYRSPITHEAAFQNLMPAFVGLFTMPWLILNFVSRVEIPPQSLSPMAGLTLRQWAAGSLAGVLGGGFAALFPVVTGGVGSLLAGHATAQRDDRAFLVSQGAARGVYYVGGFLLLFVPGLNLTRGGGAALVRGVYVPYGDRDFIVALSAVALAGALVLLLVSPLSRLTLWMAARWGYRRISAGALAAAGALVLGLTGPGGLAVTLVAAAVGLLPVLYGARRMNCLGVILLPMACNMSGFGAAVAGWLGLL